MKVEIVSKDYEDFLDTVLKDDLYKQNNIIRYNSLDTIRRQNLGEHHAVVAQLTIKIIETLVAMGYEIDDRTKYVALAGGSIHDLGEIVFGDMNYEVKAQYPELSEISNEIEHGYICSLNGYCGVFKEAQENELAHAIYKLADALDLILFVRREHKLGNSDPYLDHIVKNGKQLAEKNIKQIFDLLSQCLLYRIDTV